MRGTNNLFVKYHALKYIAAAIGSITLLVYSFLLFGAIIVQFLGLPVVFAPQLQFRVLGGIFLGMGGCISIWVILTRGAMKMLVSTGMTFIKLFAGFSIKEIGGRNEHLVIRGPHKYTRNPLYLGAIISFVGWSMMIDSTASLVGACLATLWFVMIQIPFEEKELVALFGSDYTSYAKGVPVLIPFTKPGKSGAASKVSRTLHHIGSLLFVLIFTDAALGVALSVSRPALLMIVHVLLGMLLIILSGVAIAISYLNHRWVSCFSSMFIFLALCSPAISGLGVILTGNTHFLAIDKMLALVALVSSLGLVISTSTAVDVRSKSSAVS